MHVCLSQSVFNLIVTVLMYIFLLPFPHHLAILGKDGKYFSQGVKTRTGFSPSVDCVAKETWLFIFDFYN